MQDSRYSQAIGTGSANIRNKLKAPHTASSSSSEDREASPAASAGRFIGLKRTVPDHPKRGICDLRISSHGVFCVFVAPSSGRHARRDGDGGNCFSVSRAVTRERGQYLTLTLTLTLTQVNVLYRLNSASIRECKTTTTDTKKNNCSRMEIEVVRFCVGTTSE